jgi:Ni,Fe-hydrogenase maturation factor
MKPKLADILFTVALSIKLTQEASSAIKAVLLLVEDLAEEDFSTVLSDKISLKIGTAIDDLRSEISNAK